MYGYMGNEEKANSGGSHKSERADKSKNEILSQDSNVFPQEKQNMEKESKSESVNIIEQTVFSILSWGKNAH